MLIILKCRHIFVDVWLIMILLLFLFIYLFILFAHDTLKMTIAKPAPRSAHPCPVPALRYLVRKWCSKWHHRLLLGRSGNLLLNFPWFLHCFSCSLLSVFNLNNLKLPSGVVFESVWKCKCIVWIWLPHIFCCSNLCRWLNCSFWL